MSHAMRKRMGKTMRLLGAAGLLALASGASAEAPVDTATPNTGVSRGIWRLSTVFDKESVSSLKPGVELARGGCGGCGHGYGGCGGFRGCGAFVAVAEVADSASALEVAAVVAAAAAAWAGGDSTA
jgi:hypothetical protein